MGLDPGKVIRPVIIQLALGRETKTVALRVVDDASAPTSILLRLEQAYDLQAKLEEMLGKPEDRPGYAPARPARLS